METGRDENRRVIAEEDDDDNRTSNLCQLASASCVTAASTAWAAWIVAAASGATPPLVACRCCCCCCWYRSSRLTMSVRMVSVIAGVKAAKCIDWVRTAAMALSMCRLRACALSPYRCVSGRHSRWGQHTRTCAPHRSYKWAGTGARRTEYSQPDPTHTKPNLLAVRGPLLYRCLLYTSPSPRDRG